jgi:hypothetical protein
LSHTNFLGIRVEGTITPAGRVPQRPLAELQPALLDLLRDPEIDEFGWRQYTPYFNDGDPCVFTADELWVRTVHDHDADPGDLLIADDYDYVHPTLGRAGHDGYDYSASPHAPRIRPYEGTDEPRYWRARAVADALSSRAFNDVLMDAFGDHATVTVRRTGILVEFFKHE